MHLSTVAATGLLTLAALTPAPADAQGRPGTEPYRAQGTEPFWAASIGAVQMRFEPAEGPVISVPKPRPIIGFNGERYQTPRLTIDVTHVECRNGMSDRTYQDTVAVTSGRRTWRGCGGAALARATSPVNGDWRVLAIDGQPSARGTQPTISFAGTRVTGNTGCNSFNGAYRVERGRVTIGPLATTKRACLARPANVQEQTLLRLLGQPLRAIPQRGGGVSLTAPGGQSLLLARTGRP